MVSVEKNIMEAADEILNLAEVAIGDPHRYNAFRSKVLRSLNNAARDINKELKEGKLYEFTAPTS